MEGITDEAHFTQALVLILNFVCTCFVYFVYRQLSGSFPFGVFSLYLHVHLK